jgi:hypothetical protein
VNAKRTRDVGLPLTFGDRPADEFVTLGAYSSALLV